MTNGVILETSPATEARTLWGCGNADGGDGALELRQSMEGFASSAFT